MGQNDRPKPAATIFEPTEFQAEIIAMDIDAFVAKTNIGDIVLEEMERRSEKTKPPVTAERIAARIEHYYEKRLCIDQWWLCGLKHLRYKWWQNKPKSSADAMVQTDRADLKDASTECELDHDIGVNESVVHVSQSTQTQETQNDAQKRMADQSVGRDTLPGAEREQQSAETIIEEIAKHNNDDCATEATAAMESIKVDLAEANDDIGMISVSEDTSNGGSDLASAEQAMLKNGMDEQIEEAMVLAVFADGTCISDHSVKSTESEQKESEVLVQVVTEILAVNAGESTKNDEPADDHQDIEMVNVAEANAKCETADQPVFISDTIEMDKENMFEEVMDDKSVDTWCSDHFDKSTPTEKQHNVLKSKFESISANIFASINYCFHTGQRSLLDLESMDDTENTNPNRGHKLGPKCKKKVHVTNDTDEKMPPFNGSGALEQSDADTSQAENDLSKQTPDLTENSSTQSPEECDGHGAKAVPTTDVDDVAIKEPVSPTESSKSDEKEEECDKQQGAKEVPTKDAGDEAKNEPLSPTESWKSNEKECDEHGAKEIPTMDVDDEAIKEPTSESNEFPLTLPNEQNPKCARFLEKSNSNDDDFEAAQPPSKKKKMFEIEHSYALFGLSIPHPNPQNVIMDADICVIGSSPSLLREEGGIRIATSPVHPQAEFIFKIPQSDHHEFLYRFNFENTLRRLTVGTRTSAAAAINCQEQMKQHQILRLDASTVHRVELYGECPEKLLQLKCKTWREVQCLLEVVKNYAYKLNVSEPPARSILGRVLHQFFVKSSTFTSVRILNVQKDRREVTTAFGLKPKHHHRNGSAIDPFYLDKLSYDSKRMRKTQMR